jgi:hypothetical protein
VQLGWGFKVVLNDFNSWPPRPYTTLLCDAYIQEQHCLFLFIVI